MTWKNILKKEPDKERHFRDATRREQLRRVRRNVDVDSADMMEGHFPTSEKLAEEIEGILVNYLDQHISDEDYIEFDPIKTEDVKGYGAEIELEETEEPEDPKTGNWIYARVWGPKGEMMIIDRVRDKPIDTVQNTLDEVDSNILVDLLEEVKNTFH